MDPQATFQRLMDAIALEDNDEAQQAFEDLHYWLNHGGFAPKVTTLGTHTVNTSTGQITIPTRTIHSPDRRYAIMTNDREPNNVNGPFIFVVYNHRNNRVATFDLTS